MTTPTLNPRPVCPECGTSTVRAATTAGKGRYTCPNRECKDSFKVYHIRGSKKAEATS